METTPQKAPAKEIDLIQVFLILWKSRRLFYWVLPITFVVSALLILCVPRYYQCQVTLVPETGSSTTNSLGSLASSFGINLGGGGSTSDAISPTLYPDLMTSSRFTTRMFSVEVETIDGELRTNYFEYLLRHQKKAWWSQLLSVFSETDTATLETVDLFRLTELQSEIANLISKKISCSINKKTEVISISVTDQDPLVAATLADSVCVRLQSLITQYRTSKARLDLEYTEHLYNQAKAEYASASQRYAEMYDANQDVVMNAFRTKIDDLEKEKNLAYNIYSNLAVQLQAAQAKLQERTPAFTEIQSATVPNRPAGPKRVIFVLAMCFVAACVASGYLIFKNRKEIF